MQNIIKIRKYNKKYKLCSKQYENIEPTYYCTIEYLHELYGKKK